MVTAQKMSGTPALLGVAVATFYTCPVNTKARIMKLVLSNNTALARTVNVYIVPSGDAADSSNAIWTLVVVAPYGSKECFEAEGQILSAGDFIQANSDAATSVAISGSVVELT